MALVLGSGLATAALVDADRNQELIHASRVASIHRRMELEPPEYEQDELPNYERHDSVQLLPPIVSYHLRQINRGLQLLVPFGPCEDRSYKLTIRTGPSLFSKKPDITLTRVSRAASKEEPVALVKFDVDGPLPWLPRAKVQYCPDGESWKSCAMEARDHCDWTIDIDGISYYWGVDDNPTSLALAQWETGSIRARFIYSALGTQATNGGEVGELVVYSGWPSTDLASTELLICSASVAICHWKRLGRHYRSGGRTNVSLRNIPLPTRGGSTSLFC